MVPKEKVEVNGRRAQNVINDGVTAIFCFIFGQPVRVLVFLVYAALDGAYILVAIVLVCKPCINGVVCCNGGGPPSCGEQK
jgi:hypothetical protein